MGTGKINKTTGIPYWKERREKNKEGVKYIEKNSYLKQKYGITLEEYRSMVKAQNSSCAICNTKVDTEPKGKGKSHNGFALDHNHQTGKVRGLLCYKCNLALGHFRDSPFLIERALAYVSQNDGGPTKASDIKGAVPDSIKDYRKLKIQKDRLLLTGDAFFYTFQGEGQTIGHPCVFARLHHCNLHCDFCDAFYSWKRESREFWIEPISVTFNEAAKSIESTWGCQYDDLRKRVVWTGGEPLIQKAQIDEIVQLLGSRWDHEVETNGTLMPTDTQLQTFQFNCSPKLQNNIADRKELRIRPKILKALNEVNTTFKFVCRTVSDLEEIEQDYVPYISQDKIIIMGEGVTSRVISYHIQNLVEPCMKRGWRMTPRFQAIFADGAKRGV